MSEYIDKEDALKEAKAWSMYGKDDLVSRIENLPSIDVVKCRDCKWCKHYEQDEQDCYFCTNECGLDDDRAEDDYCSFGERKEEGE